MLFDTTVKTIHVFVALCDNKFQGIVPVPARIGNGQDKENNLYWGCAGGVRSYFKNSKNWILVKQYPMDSARLERAVFKHRYAKYYLVADAYDGKYIRQCTTAFLKSCAGIDKDVMELDKTVIGTNGNAVVVAYTGHDGLMDFQLNTMYQNADGQQRQAIILACKSRQFFAGQLKASGAYPLVWSTGLMSPEAYTLHDALETYIDHGDPQQVRMSAAKAYARFQKCSVSAAAHLLVTGF